MLKFSFGLLMFLTSSFALAQVGQDIVAHNCVYTKDGRTLSKGSVVVANGGYNGISFPFQSGQPMAQVYSNIYVSHILRLTMHDIEGASGQTVMDRHFPYDIDHAEIVATRRGSEYRITCDKVEFDTCTEDSERIAHSCRLYQPNGSFSSEEIIMDTSSASNHIAPVKPADTYLETHIISRMEAGQGNVLYLEARDGLNPGFGQQGSFDFRNDHASVEQVVGGILYRIDCKKLLLCRK